VAVSKNYIICQGMKNGRYDRLLDANTPIDALSLVSFDDHSCDYQEQCQKEIMAFIKEEIQNINVEFLASRVIRDALFNKEYKKNRTLFPYRSA